MTAHGPRFVDPPVKAVAHRVDEKCVSSKADDEVLPRAEHTDCRRRRYGLWEALGLSSPMPAH